MTFVLPSSSGPMPSVWGEDVRIVVWVSGEQDISTAANLAERLDAAAALGTGNLIVDLSHVPFVDAATVRAFVHCAARLRLQSRWLSLRGPQPFVRRVLEICGLVDLLDLVDPSPEASSLVTLPRPG